MTRNVALDVHKLFEERTKGAFEQKETETRERIESKFRAQRLPSIIKVLKNLLPGAVDESKLKTWVAMGVHSRDGEEERCR